MCIINRKSILQTKFCLNQKLDKLPNTYQQQGVVFGFGFGVNFNLDDL